MAPVVKRLRPRIVVPICMGSNPIRRPINKLPKGSFFMRMVEMRTHFSVRARSEQSAESFTKRMEFFEAKHVGTFNASDSRQSHQAPHF